MPTKLFHGINVPGTILLGLITAAIGVIIFQPLVNITQGLGGFSSNIIFDYYFYCAATRNETSFLNTIVYLSVIFLYCYLFSKLIDNHQQLNLIGNELNSLVTNFNDKLQIPENSVVESNCAEQITTESVIADSIAIQRRLDETQKLHRSAKIKSYIMLFLLSIVIIYVIAFVYFPSDLKTSFERTLTKITPYSDRATIDTLRSDWVRMKSKKDYKNIQAKIEAIIKQNELE